jgi:hypothetical protein
VITAAPVARPSLCRGRRVYRQDHGYRYDCDWLQCPILWADELCPFRLSDDDPNPDDEPPPAEARDAA